jgi:hypothetical protein
VKDQSESGAPPARDVAPEDSPPRTEDKSSSPPGISVDDDTSPEAVEPNEPA